MKTRNKIFFSLIILVVLIYTFINNILVNTDPLYKYQWGLRSDKVFKVQKNELRSNNKVRFYDENIKNQYIILNDNDEINEYSKHDYLFSNNVDINFLPLKQYTFNDEVVVAIIDTGIDIHHEDLSGKIWYNNKEIASNGIDDDNNGYIDDINGYNFLDNTNQIYKDEIIDGHGTHIAGVIAANESNGIGVTGLCSDFVKIMPLKVLGQDGNGNVIDLVRAIKYAHDNGAKICNISLGTRTYDAELDKIIKEYDDMLFVVAAGNGTNFIGYDINVKEVYPGSLDYDNVITVSNLGFDGDRYESSNYGKKVTIFAPGTYIISTMPNNKYGFITGSSIATPYVTGVAAMMLSLNKNLDIKEIKNIIIKTANKKQILENLCKSGGVLNAYEAVKMALNNG